jgi:hypothetical protein
MEDFTLLTMEIIELPSPGKYHATSIVAVINVKTSMGWVPILTQAIQEQQDLIEELKTQLEIQNKLILELSQKIR